MIFMSASRLLSVTTERTENELRRTEDETDQHDLKRPRTIGQYAAPE